MSRLVLSDAQIRAVIPNIAVAAKGENPWVARLEPFLEEAEHRIGQWIVPLDELPQELSCIAERMTIWYAWHLAVPSIDLVATPNGFAVVSNQNLAPASTQRVEAMRREALRNADREASRLLDGMMYDVPQWRDGTTAHLYRTVFLTPRIFATYFSTDQGWFRTYHDRLDLIRAAQADLADRFLSQPVLDMLCSPDRVTDTCASRAAVHARNAVASVMRHEPFMADVLGIISTFRTYQDSDISKKWFASTQAEAFNTKDYENENHSPGFFF